MRRLSLLLVIALAACGGRSGGPAWPKQAEPEKDGGESIAPRAGATAKVIEAAAEDATEDKPVAVAATKPAAAPADAAAAPQPTPAGTTPTDDIIITTEEIVIEIDE